MLYELLNNIMPELPTGTVRTCLNLTAPPIHKPVVYKESLREEKAEMAREAILAAVDDENDRLGLIAEETGMAVTTIKNYVKKMAKEGILEINHIVCHRGGKAWQIRRAA